MALSLGTNCGFVTTAPTADPAGTNITFDDAAFEFRDTVPNGYGKITEIGWWCDTATSNSNFEVGLYTDFPAGNNLLQASRTNAKGTTAGWKRVTGLNWKVTYGTKYLIAVQLDNTTTTNGNIYTSGGDGYWYDNAGATTLQNPFDYVNSNTNGLAAIYAVVDYQVVNPLQISVAGSWKSSFVNGLSVAGSWKGLSNMYVSVAGSWKSISETLI